MISVWRLCLTLLTIVCVCSPSSAHEVRPAYLEITESAPQTYDVTWKQPILDGRRLRIDPVFPSACTRETETVQIVSGAQVARWTLSCALEGETIGVNGLERTLTDVFVRVNWLDGTSISGVLRPSAETLDLSSPQGAPVLAYLRIGVEHIVFGWDHLLFVFGIILLVRRQQLLLTITAFTLAHSITLGLAVLAGVSLPGPPVEIVIALSIALLGVEAVDRLNGRPGLGARWPWAVAFGFGLIHGFGFAGALADIGLPSGARAVALLLFNLGVELGQIGVIAIVLAVGALIARTSPAALRSAQYAGAYLIGIAGTFWTIERIFGSFLA